MSSAKISGVHLKVSRTRSNPSTANIFSLTLKHKASPHCSFSLASGKSRQYARMESTFMKTTLPPCTLRTQRKPRLCLDIETFASLRVLVGQFCSAGSKADKSVHPTRVARLIVFKILDHGHLAVGHVKAEALAVALRCCSATGDHHRIVASRLGGGRHASAQQGCLQAAATKALQRSRAAQREHAMVSDRQSGGARHDF